MNDLKFGLYTSEELREMCYIDPGKTIRVDDPEKETSKSLLLEAHATVHSKRVKEYGPFSKNMETAVKFFNILRSFGHIESGPLSPVDGAWFLLCLKLARESTKHKRDNLLDAAGYLELIDELLQEGGTTSDG